jgi:deoxyribose-phosphate aldolase
MTQHPRNAGIPLDMGLVCNESRINLSAVERRASTMDKRRSVKQAWQAAWLLKAITCMDLTTLAGDDTPGKVHRLALKARQPVRSDILEALGMVEACIQVGAVCVYHNRVKEVVAALKGSQIPVAAVSTGFPAGQIPHDQKLREIEQSVRDGAAEIDIVISREHVLRGNWQALYDEIKDFRQACGEAHMKSILATGELETLRNVAKASWVAMMAGSDFIKTSTGKESVNATLPVTLVMVRTIREYEHLTSFKVGFKPAGGIRTAKDALAWQILMKEELGNDWLQPDLFRFGASSLLGDIERQLSHYMTGRYAAIHHMPMG